MKKISLLTLALIVTLMASTASASNGFGYLYAGQDTIVGTVTVSNDGTNLKVTFRTYSGWLMTEANLHVATDLEDIPKTKKGSPKIGKFDYKHEHGSADADQYTYIVALPAGSPLYIAAHAVVQTGSGDDLIEETAWGWCDNPQFGGNFPGGSWATYMIYYP